MSDDELPDFEGWPRHRRVNIPYKTGRIGFSVPEGVSNEDAISEIERCLHAVAEGKTRAIINIDGDHTPMERLLVVKSYVVMWVLRLWKVSFGRSAVAKEKADISQRLRSAKPLHPNNKEQTT